MYYSTGEKRGSCFLNKILCAFIFLRKISLYIFIPLGIISINYARDTCLHHLPLIMNIIPSWKKWPPRLFLSVKTKPNIRIYLNLNFVLNNSTNLILLSNYSNINLVKGERERERKRWQIERILYFRNNTWISWKRETDRKARIGPSFLPRYVSFQ